MPGQRPKPQRSWRFYVGVGAALLALILIFQNFQDVEINFLFATTSAPLIFILVIVFALGALTGWLFPHVRRGRKREEND